MRYFITITPAKLAVAHMLDTRAAAMFADRCAVAHDHKSLQHAKRLTFGGDGDYDVICITAADYFAVLRAATDKPQDGKDGGLPVEASMPKPRLPSGGASKRPATLSSFYSA